MKSNRHRKGGMSGTCLRRGGVTLCAAVLASSALGCTVIRYRDRPEPEPVPVPVAVTPPPPSVVDVLIAVDLDPSAANLASPYDQIVQNIILALPATRITIRQVAVAPLRQRIGEVVPLLEGYDTGGASNPLDVPPDLHIEPPDLWGDAGPTRDPFDERPDASLDLLWPDASTSLDEDSSLAFGDAGNPSIEPTSPHRDSGAAFLDGSVFGRRSSGLPGSLARVVSDYTVGDLAPYLTDLANDDLDNLLRFGAEIANTSLYGESGAAALGEPFYRPVADGWIVILISNRAPRCGDDGCASAAARHAEALTEVDSDGYATWLKAPGTGGLPLDQIALVWIGTPEVASYGALVSRCRAQPNFPPVYLDSLEPSEPYRTLLAAAVTSSGGAGFAADFCELASSLAPDSARALGGSIAGALYPAPRPPAGADSGAM